MWLLQITLQEAEYTDSIVTVYCIINWICY